MTEIPVRSPPLASSQKEVKIKKVEDVWVVEYSSHGYYPEDGSSFSVEGPYTESEAKQVVQMVNRIAELNAKLSDEPPTRDWEVGVRAHKLEIDPQTTNARLAEQVLRLEAELAERQKKDAEVVVPFNEKNGRYSLGAVLAKSGLA